MHKKRPPQLNSRAQTFVDKLFHYNYEAKKASVQMRKAFNINLMSEAMRSEIPYNIAMQQWKELCVFARTDSPVHVIVGSPTWQEMWKTIDNILETKPTCMADYFLKNIAANFAVGMVRSFELRNDPLRIPIINAAEARVHACQEELEGPGTTDFDPEFIDKAMQRNLAGIVCRRMRSVDREGSQFEFVIKDYGTSYVKGPWVKYRLLHDGKEEEEVIEIIADQIDELLKRAEFV
ncbi:hypothetical protein BJ165DRAFT_1435718 [Panaeolus papilionaceus]|nr:hypothetical protein BJ165DRAFT_1435718 [Panaeolus papilionaceus]